MIVAHKYAVGDTVVFSNRQSVRVAAGAYEVRALLPELGGSLQYRLKSQSERYERVVSEDELAAGKLL